MHSLSRTKRSRKDVVMVLDMARPKNRKEYHMAWNAWKRCCKKVDSQGQHFTGIHDRFLRDPVYRETQLAIGWTEQKCKEGKNGTMKLPYDFRDAVLMKNRLHHESGEQVEEPIHPDQYRRWHPSSSTSWWDKCEWNWK